MLSPIADRFWPKVAIIYDEDSCWVWTASKHSKRGSEYGQIKVTRTRKISAHRASWEINFGPIPEGMCVCHRCDNPSCVRPDHLFLGTQKENLVDCRDKGRLGGCVGFKGPSAFRAKLTAAQIQEIRAQRGIQTAVVLAQRFGVTRQTISRNWKSAAVASC